MTSQIVLINQSGIAIASDTMTSYNRGNGRVKTYPTANKIYELANNSQVVVLHSGCTAIDDLHYELLVREWSLQLNGLLPTLEDYPRVFDDWLANYRRLRVDEHALSSRICCESFELVLDQMGSDAWKGITATKASESALDRFTQSLRSFADQRFKDPNPYPDLTEESVLDYIRDLRDSQVTHFLEHLCKRVSVEKFEWTPGDDLAAAIEYFLVQRFLYRNSWCNSASANLVFAGFGADEPIGGVVQMQIDSFFMGRLRFSTLQRDPMSGSSNTAVQTFAQDDAIWDFIRGLSGQRQEWLLSLAEKSLRTSLSSGLNDDQAASFRDQFSTALSGALFDGFTSPFRDTVQALSLSNLVQLGESMIRIQSLRSVASKEEATVGGRIESLCIRRGADIHWHFRYDDEHSSNVNPVHPLI